MPPEIISHRLYNDLRKKLVNSIKHLPPSELNYYFTLLMRLLDEEPEQYIWLLEKIAHLSEQVALLLNRPDDWNEALEVIPSLLEDIVRESKDKKVSTIVLHVLAKIFSSVTMLLCAVAYSAIFFGAGLLSNYNIIDNLKNAFHGFVGGMLLGVVIGYRFAHSMFENQYQRHLNLCLVRMINATKKISAELDENTQESMDNYSLQAKKYILDTFFSEVKDKEAAFLHFLDSEQQFQVATIYADFELSSLKGSLGHHALIRYKVNGKVGHPIEWGRRKLMPDWESKDWAAAKEATRQVTGQKLYEMIVLDIMLQKSHGLSQDIVKKYTVGFDDCHTYVDKILVGTGQLPRLEIQRFMPSDSFIGRHLVARAIRFFSPPENLLTQLDEGLELLPNP